MFWYPGCLRKLLLWRTVLVLTVLATVLQAITMMLSWHVSEVERRLKDDESTANEKASLYFKHIQSQPWSSKNQNFKLMNNTHKQFLPYSSHLHTEHHTEYNFDHPVNKKKGKFYYGAKGLTAELSEALSTLAHQSIIDSSGQYRIAMQFFVSTASTTNIVAGHTDDIAFADSAGEVAGRVLVSVATQCSSQHLHRVPELAQTWQGPVSVAVFSQRHEVQWLLQTILLLRRCYNVVRANVTFSIVTPLSAGEAGQAGRELPPPLLAPLSQKRMQDLLSETASGRRLHGQYEENEILTDSFNRRKWKDQEKLIGSKIISFEREKMMFRRRQINSNFKNFTRFFGVSYSPKYSRRKMLDDKNTVIEKKVNNSVNSKNSKNIDVNHSRNKSPSRIINKLQRKLSAHTYENYRYISNTHHDSIEKPSPDSTSCNKLLDLSPSHLSNVTPGANGSNNSNKKGEPQPNYSFNDVEYPNNLLRNVAVDAVTTEFVLVLDIDMIPSAGLLEHFSHLIRSNGLSSAGRSHVQQLLKDHYIVREGKSSETKLSDEKNIIYQDVFPNSFLLLSDKLAFVLPAYEVEEDVAMPDTREDLLKRVKEGKARPFYDQLCQKCQRPTNYSAWEQLQLPTSQLSVTYEVPWQDPWEPFYITSRATLPRYDERFRQYGFNRISQVCEAHVSGLRFVVLWPAFVVHRGYKRTSALHVTKERELLRNRLLFREFKRQLKTKYPMSRRRCY